MLRRAGLALVVLVAAGCGGSGERADGGGAAGRDGGRDSLLGRFDVSTGGTGALDAAAVDRGTPNPGTIIYQGSDALLLDFGPACTAEEGATGDRWCGFFAASPTTADAADLFVFNASRAAAGTAITCGLASEPNCLKLTADFVENATHAAFFQGDTLVYFDATGTPFGWRPGMTAGRALAVASPTTLDIVGCVPARKGTAIACMRTLPKAAGTSFTPRDLLLGTVDGAATPPLARVDTLITENSADGNVARFAFRFLPDGQSLAWSTRMTATGVEVLKTQRAGDDASRAEIGSDIHGWDASRDGSHWTWLAQYNATSGTGILESAAFPGGGGRIANGSNIAQWGFVNARALVIVDAQLAMSAIGEPLTAPTTTAPLDTGVLAFLDISTQGHIAYAKNYDPNADLTDLHVKRWDATGAACTLTATANGFYKAFLFMPGGSGAAWARAVGTRFELMFTRLSDCTTTPVAPPGATYVDASSDRGIVYVEQAGGAAGTGALSFRPLTSSAELGEPTYVAWQVGSLATVATPGGIVYSVNGGGNEDGIYFHPGP